MMNSRIYYLDMARVLACFLVILTHSVMPNIPENGKWLGFMSFICSPSSELFLMLSGAILLPVKTDMITFYKRRFLKLLPPMFVWSCFGILLRYLQGVMSLGEACKSFVLMPFKPIVGVYWFLYVMVGLYLFAPIVSCWLRTASKKQVQFFLVLWILNMIAPWICLVVPDFYDQNGSYYWVLCNFGGFLGYWVLGYYLRTYPPTLCSVVGIGSIVLSLVYFVAIIGLKSIGVKTTSYVDNLQIGSVFLIVTIFILVKILSDSSFGQKFLNNQVAKLAQYSFGIYLLHFYVIRDGVWHIMDNFRIINHPVFESLFISLFSMFVCYTIIRLFSFVYKPLGKWMFGLK